MAARRPSLPPTLPSTSVSWAIAEAANTAQAWDAVAAAYEHELETCKDASDEVASQAPPCRETIYALVLARKNALTAQPLPAPPPPGERPVEVPPRVQAVVDALDSYIAIADPDDPDLAGMKFLAGNARARYRQPDAIERFEAVIRDYPTAEFAEYAANLLLDALMRQDRITELRAWVDRLLGDPGFLAGKPALQQTLERLRDQLAGN